MNATLFHRCIVITLLLLALAGCATHAPPSVPSMPPHTVVLVSIDAFRPDYMDRGLTPNLAALARDGVSAAYMLPSFPSLTFPNHYTLVTGRVPDRNGIVNNRMSDPVLGFFSNRDATFDGRWWDEAEPIWVTAQKHGLHTISVFWPGSVAEIHGVRPDRWLLYNASMGARQRVDQLLAWMAEPGPRTSLATIYLDEVDHAGHESGPDSPQLDTALREVDDALGHLVDELRRRGLYDTTNLIVLSDHGMADVPEGNTVFADEQSDLDALIPVSYGVIATFNPKPGVDGSKAVARLLGPHQHMRCYRRQELPARLDYGRNPRVPAYVCLADTGWAIISHAVMAQRTAPMSRGEHGYDNLDPSMRALFVAHGPGFGRGVTIAPFPNVDVYPLLAYLLGIEPLANDGTLEPLRGLLAPSR